MKYSEEEKKAYYNQIMRVETMTIEEAENIIDDMYQEKYEIIEEKIENGVKIYLDKLKDVKFTYLEFASVRMLREVQKLRRELEKQQKEIERLYKDNYRLDRENQLKFERAVDTSDYVSKEAIREKIKEIEDSLKEDCIALHEFQRLAKIDVLKQLLGE